MAVPKTGVFRRKTRNRHTIPEFGLRRILELLLMAVPKTGVFRRKSVLPRRADDAEAAAVVVPAVGVVVAPVRDGTA